jgi:hypothetical protein
MKKIILGLSILLAFGSCKSTKNADCDSYGSIEPRSMDFDFVSIDTLYLEEEHIHIEEESLCGWSPAHAYIIIDTVKIREIKEN